MINGKNVDWNHDADDLDVALGLSEEEVKGANEFARNLMKKFDATSELIKGIVETDKINDGQKLSLLRKIRRRLANPATVAARAVEDIHDAIGAVGQENTGRGIALANVVVRDVVGIFPDELAVGVLSKAKHTILSGAMEDIKESLEKKVAEIFGEDSDKDPIEKLASLISEEIGKDKGKEKNKEHNKMVF